MRTPPVVAAVGAALALAVAGCASAAPSGGAEAGLSSAPASVSRAASASPSPATAGPVDSVPRPAHTVVVMMENHAYQQIIGNPATPYINELAHSGALFTQSYAITHPSQPNYIALFSGSTQGVTGDSCPTTLTSPNLASGLLASGMTFAGYAEGLPATGSLVCNAGEYARRHVPWADFSNIPASVNQPFTNFPAGDYTQLPTVSFVIPNVCNDMHDCSASTGDKWLRANLSDYATWAMTHDSLLILTWDEDDDTASNQITTIFVGQHVRPASYSEHITHYSILATIEAAYGLRRDGAAAGTAPITDVWQS